MAKRICEDWASALMNEKVEITVAGENNQAYLDEQIKNLEFKHNSNMLIEKAFATGTGAYVLRFDNMLNTDDKITPDAKATIRLEYLDATYILPLTVIGGKIIEVVFASDVTYRGKEYVYIETHLIEDNPNCENGKEYVITNEYFEQSNGVLSPAELPDYMIESYSTGSDIPLFAIVKPAIVKNIEHGNGMGLSVYANAIDELEGCDLAFNNFCRDFKLGGKKVFYSKSLVRYDDTGNPITPDDVAQQLFMELGDNDGLSEDKKPLTEYNPLLRVAENKEGIQAMLDYLSFKCGMGTKRYQFNSGSIVTATQYSGDRQDMIQHAAKHNTQLRTAIIQISRAILWAGKNVCGVNVDETAEINVVFDDGFFTDDDAKRESDRQDVHDNVMTKVEYRMRWYGEDEETARAKLSENEVNDNPFGFTDE